MTRRLPPYLRLVDEPVVGTVNGVVPPNHNPAPAGITVRMQSTADVARRLVDAAMDGLLDTALDYGLIDAFRPATRDAIAAAVERELEVWTSRYSTARFSGLTPLACHRASASTSTNCLDHPGPLPRRSPADRLGG